MNIRNTKNIDKLTKFYIKASTTKQLSTLWLKVNSLCWEYANTIKFESYHALKVKIREKEIIVLNDF